MRTEAELDAELSRPSQALLDMMLRLDGDIAILGIAGKMGLALGRMAARAVAESGVRKKIIGVSRFSDQTARDRLEANGVQTMACDLMEHEAVRALPEIKNVIYMVGRKFGTVGAEALTWAINTVVPAYVAPRFHKSRIVMFSSGCVYPPVIASGGGCKETDKVDPVGEYAQACVGRERVFEHFSSALGTPMLLYRLNYAIDLRYGVLHDIASLIKQGKPVSLNVPAFNCIWQRDANERALLCLEHCRTPAALLNITGPETVSVRDTAIKLGEKLDKPVMFAGDEGERAYLSNARESVRLFGKPGMSVDEMIAATAEWFKAGGTSLNKPTHFEVGNGVY